MIRVSKIQGGKY